MEEYMAHLLVDEITGHIRDRIMSGALPMGMPIRPAELSTEFGISRTPIREALRRLQSDGLIEMLPNRAASVRVPAPWEVREAYEIRAQLEGLATARAAGRMRRADLDRLRRVNQQAHDLTPGQAGSAWTDHAFHTLILDNASNGHLRRAVRDIDQSFPRNVPAQLLSENPRQRDQAFAAHDRIIAALAAGDGETAAQEMRAHVIKVGEHLVHWYERRSSTVFHG
ncbi:GntR family transcriptional regulator [Kineosporia sp. NBRC 101731]|uniref:GntR family transcriptional regulator n=1 Tax=Kineosporia sp. NBRC 101731 TaxID=3032199 RepID=UPI0024A4B33B|nr:GntR family transcriptional regulator [Kineosporia sp. NBRC 101731]GLY29044.1 GntR family transcriptional regulator [Kineosporia sp. NBRC 101731]